MSNNIQLQSIFGKPLYPRIKTSNVINDAGFLAVSDSGSEGQFLIQTAEGPKWVTIQQSQLQSNYRYFSQAPQNLVTFQGLSIPVGVEAPSGNYYPVEKNSLSIGSSSVTLDITAYLAYQDTPSISGLWRAWFSSGGTLSDSFSLSDYYTKSQVDELIAGNVTERTAFVPFSSVTDNKATFTGCGIPTGVLTPSGSYYSIQKNSVEYNKQLGRTVLDVSAYLAYQDMASFSGTWTACFPTGIIGSNSSGYYTKQEVDDLFAQLSDSIQNTYYTKSEVNGFIDALSDSIDAVNTKFSSYYTKSEMDEKLQRNNMPIGTIFYYPSSVPPAGAFLLNGQILYSCNTAYPDFWDWIVEGASDSNIRVISSDSYQAELSAVGFCGAFSIDRTTGNVRLPSITDAFVESANGNNLGASIDAGLPNITGSCATYISTSKDTAQAGVGIGSADAAYSGAMQALSTGVYAYVSGAQYTNVSGSKGVSFNASRSSPIYGNSNTVQPNAVTYSICIQVFNTTTGLSNQNAAQLATQLQNKAGVNLENITASGKGVITDTAFEIDSSSYRTDLTSGVLYEAAKTCIVCAYFANTTSAIKLAYIKMYEPNHDDRSSPYNAFQIGGSIEVSESKNVTAIVPKGWYFALSKSAGVTLHRANMIEFKNSIVSA